MSQLDLQLLPSNDKQTLQLICFVEDMAPPGPPPGMPWPQSPSTTQATGLLTQRIPSKSCHHTASGQTIPFIE